MIPDGDLAFYFFSQYDVLFTILSGSCYCRQETVDGHAPAQGLTRQSFDPRIGTLTGKFHVGGFWGDGPGKWAGSGTRWCLARWPMRPDGFLTTIGDMLLLYVSSRNCPRVEVFGGSRSGHVRITEQYDMFPLPRDPTTTCCSLARTAFAVNAADDVMAT
jgi:hypothetical protein